MIFPNLSDRSTGVCYNYSIRPRKEFVKFIIFLTIMYINRNNNNVVFDYRFALVPVAAKKSFHFIPTLLMLCIEKIRIILLYVHTNDII